MLRTQVPKDCNARAFAWGGSLRPNKTSRRWLIFPPLGWVVSVIHRNCMRWHCWNPREVHHTLYHSFSSLYCRCWCTGGGLVVVLTGCWCSFSFFCACFVAVALAKKAVEQHYNFQRERYGAAFAKMGLTVYTGKKQPSSSSSSSNGGDNNMLQMY